MKRCVVILSHCDTEKKLQVLQDNISKLKKHPNLDIILTSHISLPQEIIDLVEYFTYDKSNPILKWPIRGMFFYKSFLMGGNEVYLNYIKPDYGWTVFNQILLGGTISKLKNYDISYFINYDLDIDSQVTNLLKSENSQSYFFSVKNWHDQIMFPSTLLFKVNNEQLKHILNSITLENYIKDGIPEQFLEEIIKDFNYNHPNYLVKDQIDYYNKTNFHTRSSNPFTDSIYPEFNYFISNYDFSEWYLNDKGSLYLDSTFFYDIKQEIEVKIGDQISKLYPGQNYIFNSTKCFYKKDNNWFPLVNKDENQQQYISTIEN
jgi:hypothetical protein